MYPPRSSSVQRLINSLRDETLEKRVTIGHCLISVDSTTKELRIEPEH